MKNKKVNKKIGVKGYSPKTSGVHRMLSDAYNPDLKEYGITYIPTVKKLKNNKKQRNKSWKEKKIEAQYFSKKTIHKDTVKIPCSKKEFRCLCVNSKKKVDATAMEKYEMFFLGETNEIVLLNSLSA